MSTTEQSFYFSKISNNISVSGIIGCATFEGLQFLSKALTRYMLPLQDFIQKPLHLIVQKSVVAHCDYQDEGMYPATLLWCNEYFGCKFEIPVGRFDKENNRYIFDF